MNVIKRDGTIEEYDFGKVLEALTKAFMSVEKAIPSRFLKKVKDSFDDMVERCENGEGECCIDIEKIQDLLEDMILNFLNADYNDVKKEFIRYRHERVIAREAKMLQQVNNLFQHSDDYLMKENANKKAELTNVQQSYLGGILSTYYCRTNVFPKRVLEGHDKGAYHIHDMDMRAMEGITNCCLIDLLNALYYKNGPVSTVLNDMGIDAQKKFSVACTVATQILQGVAGSQYGFPFLNCRIKRVLTTKVGYCFK